MQRLKIICAALLLIAIGVAATTSKEATNTSNEPISDFSPIIGTVDKEKAELYLLHQKQLKDSLSIYFEKAIRVGDIVGAGVSIVRGDSIVISDGFGKRSIKENANVDGETVFRLGSLSKGFGGVLAASLHSDGKLSYDDRIVKYLPEFQFGDLNNTQNVTLAHILSHTSGTPYHSFTNLIEAGLSVATIATRFDEVAPISAPGQQYSYQNAMFALVQEVIGKATGEDVKKVLSDTFFKPLGMLHTSMEHSDLLEEKNIALPHGRSGKGWRVVPLTDKYYNAVLAGGINASAGDMAKWMRFLLGHNPDVLHPIAIQQAFEPFILLGNNNKYYQQWKGHIQSSYAFGWRIHEYRKTDTAGIETVWHHGGSVNNYRNEIAVYPKDDLGICVLLNGNSKLARNVIPDLHDIVQKIYTQKKTVDVVEKG